MDTRLPLKPDVFLILMILIDGESHGYGIIKEAEERTNGELRLQAGALYRRQHRLSARLYAAALLLYPRSFRRRFDADLTAAFLDLLA